MEFPIDMSVPVLPLRKAVLYPGRTMPLNVGRAKSVAALEHALGEGWVVAVAVAVAQRPQTDGKPQENQGAEVQVEDVYAIGTLAKVERVRGNRRDGYQVYVKGVRRVRLLNVHEVDGRLETKLEPWDDVYDAEPETLAALGQSLKDLSLGFLSLLPGDNRDLARLIDHLADPVALAHVIAESLDLGLAQKQELLEVRSLKHRMLSLLDHLHKQKETAQIHNEIREKLAQKFGKQQRETILREQLHAIQEELGEFKSGKESASSFFDRIRAAGMPREVEQVAVEEARRLETLGHGSPEVHVIRNFLETLCALPWAPAGDETIDLERSQAILDKEHFGLEKVKKRILQHLAVLKLRGGNKGTILLLVGPPGVGKTSIARSIAHAMGKSFVRVSLGGSRDEADIRGHRRTYIGAMPGRIIQGIRRAGTQDPVMLLDEVDKLGRGYAGDPGAALLEVLDPEQNSRFVDHYLDVPYDLSNVVFVATANQLDGIPLPLLDRMEIIEISGYTNVEKLNVARHHLVPKQLEEHGMSLDQVEILDSALEEIISRYTREAGVRDLQRRLGAVCRAVTEKVVRASTALPVRIAASDLIEVLGKPPFTHEVAEIIVPPGVVTGLAWTPSGGDILFVEASLMPGTGKLILTGQLGDVMKESAHIALSLVRSQLRGLTPGVTFEKNDIHVHVPAGAIPKDGPSAGVTMLAALASLLTGMSVSPRLAMTGEITLRGTIMPVGGIRDKVLAAHRAGIQTVLLPKRNEIDLSEIPLEVRESMTFYFLETVGDLLRYALGSIVGSLGELPEPPTTLPPHAHVDSPL